MGALAELLGLALELGQRLGEPVRHLDLVLPAPLPFGPAPLAPGQGAHQLLLVVAAHAQPVAVGDHAHDEPQHAGRVRPAVDEVADEDGTPPVGVVRPHGAALVVAG